MRLMFWIAVGFILTLLFSGCSSNDKPSPIPPVTQEWRFMYGTVTGRCDDFDFPNSGQAGYCIRGWNGVRLGQTVKLTFTISGSGTLSAPGDNLPATIALILWGQGINDRWFGDTRIPLVPGQHTIAIPIDPARWTGVGGGVTQPPFTSILSGVARVGYTFGGRDFAGHGVRADGPVHFRLDSYQITDTVAARRKRKP